MICLVAVLLLQAPFARAAWLSSSMACCMGDKCPIPSHHHKPVAAKSEMPMDCEHHSSKMTDCKISCCKTADESVISIAQFVMPAPQGVPLFETAAPSPLQVAPPRLSRPEKPQSPPPRNILA